MPAAKCDGTLNVKYRVVDSPTTKDFTEDAQTQLGDVKPELLDMYMLAIL